MEEEGIREEPHKGPSTLEREAEAIGVTRMQHRTRFVTDKFSREFRLKDVAYKSKGRSLRGNSLENFTATAIIPSPFSHSYLPFER